MDIPVLLSLVSYTLQARAGPYTGFNNPRSARAILNRIYGPPIGSHFSARTTSERASSAQFPMVASTLALKYNKQNPEDLHSFKEEFKAGGVIITKWIVISVCSYFFVPSDDKTLISIDDPESQVNKEENKFILLNYLVRAGHFFVPNATGITSRSKPQSIPIQNMTAHPKCATTLNTDQQLMYDTVALQLATPFAFDEYVTAASFYSLNLEFLEDKLEEMQEINARCRLVIPTPDGVLLNSNVQILDGNECNSLMCMIGIGAGESCREQFSFYDMGAFCTLSANGDVPCEMHGGVLLCDRQVYGIAVSDYCEVCAPHVISKPMAMIYLAKMYADKMQDTLTQDTEELRRNAEHM